MNPVRIDPTETPPAQPGKTALMLPGGGARGAYQVGVLKGIAEICGHRQRSDNPFPIITGTSAGAINAVVLATHAHEFAHGIERLEMFWSRLHCHNIYRTDAWTVAKTGLRALGALLFGRFGLNAPRSLLDNSPLAELLQRELQLANLPRVIKQKQLQALAITASSYTTAVAETFFEGAPHLHEWQRYRRFGHRADIGPEHILASSALPFLFPAQRIGNEYYGDGGLRLLAPLSPAIHLGADNILVIGTRDETPIERPTRPVSYPSMGEVAGYLLDTIFMDTLWSDISRLQRINRTLQLLPESERLKSHLRPIQTLVIKPSRDVRDITREHAEAIPRPVKNLLKVIGGWGKDWRMPSYLLFEPAYTTALIELGYRDAISKQEIIADFLA
jgi:NTE family protein